MTTAPAGAARASADEPAQFPLVLGLDTFGDVTYDADGRPLSHAQTIRNLLDQGVLADQVGVDFFGIGEHHTDDFPLSAADVVLAAIAARTTRIRLGSAVTVLSSDDPVRVFQRYSTLNAISGGRAEVILGRGSSIDSFPLFGYDLADYEDLFEEKTNLFAELLKGGPVTWHGVTRASLNNQDVVPHTESGPFPTWIGVGGSPQSVIRAAHYGFSLMLAIIGGNPARFTPFSQLFQQALERFGQSPRPVGVHSPVTSPPPTSRPAPSSGRTISRSSVASARPADSPSQLWSPSCARSGPRERSMSGRRRPSHRRSRQTSLRSARPAST
jgi:alkanesulfonate monooxygenase SsuD/methylene tetrahydromethanopterin reductase-like flavin-dependent oxidoreductase (luciferase family)